MKVHVYISLHIFVCLFICNSVHSKAISPLDSITMLENVREPKKICGSEIGNTLDLYCKILPNSDFRVKRQVSDECCKTPCSLHYLMQYYCVEATDQYKEYLSANIPTTNTHSLSNNVRKTPSSDVSTQWPAERINQSSENNKSGQVRQHFIWLRKPKGRWGKHVGKRKKKCRCSFIRRRCKVASIPFTNQIRKEKAETTTRLAPRFGIYTSKKPYIFGHSLLNKTGQMNYPSL